MGVPHSSQLTIVFGGFRLTRGAASRRSRTSAASSRHPSQRSSCSVSNNDKQTRHFTSDILIVIWGARNSAVFTVRRLSQNLPVYEPVIPQAISTALSVAATVAAHSVRVARGGLVSGNGRAAVIFKKLPRGTRKLKSGFLGTTVYSGYYRWSMELPLGPLLNCLGHGSNATPILHNPFTINSGVK
jgi:hypothetical protein